MRWPYIARYVHDIQVQDLNNRIHDLEQELTDVTMKNIELSKVASEPSILRQRLKDKDKEIQALIEQLTATKCNDYTQKDPQKSESVPEEAEVELADNEPITMGRGGWRRKSFNRTMKTLVPPKDSMQQLEDRIKREGGTV